MSYTILSVNMRNVGGGALMGATTLDGPWTAVPADGNPALRFFKAVLPLP